MKRRFLSILLCLLLAVQLLPATALAAGEGADYAIVGGQLLHYQGTPVYAVTDKDGQVTLAPELGEGDSWNIRWDGQTLTLRSATIKGQKIESVGALCGIVTLGSSGCTIQNEGTTLIQVDGAANTEAFAILSVGGTLKLENSGELSIQCSSTADIEDCWMHGIYCSTEPSSGTQVYGDLEVVNDGAIEISVRCPAADYAEINVNTAICAERLTWSGSGTAAVSGNMMGEAPYYMGIYASSMTLNSGTLTVTADGNAIELPYGELTVNDGTLTAEGGVDGAGSGICDGYTCNFNGGTITATGFSSDTSESAAGIQMRSINISSKATLTARAGGSNSTAVDGRIHAVPEDGDSMLLYAGADENSAELYMGMPIQVEFECSLSGERLGYVHFQAGQALFPHQASYRLHGHDYDGIYWSFWQKELEIADAEWEGRPLESGFVNYGSSALVQRELLDQAGDGSLTLHVWYKDTYDYGECDISFPTDTGSGMLFLCQAAVDEKTAITQVKLDDTTLAAGDYEVRGSALVILKACLDKLDVGEHTVTCVLADGKSYQSTLTIPQVYTLTLEGDGTDGKAVCTAMLNGNRDMVLISPGTWPVLAGDRVVARSETMESGYRFAYWSQDGQKVSTEDEYEFVVEGDTSLTAVCEPDIADSVFAGGKAMVSDGAASYATTDESGGVTLQPDYTEGDNWNLKFQNGTLTLRNAVISGILGQYDGTGIYCPSNLTIVLEGENVVTSAGAADAPSSCGISCGNELVLEGGGTASLTVSGGQGEYYSSGIDTYGNLRISGCTVEAVGGASVDSSGIYCSGDVTLENCTVTASASGPDGISISASGVYVLGTEEQPVSVKAGADAASAVEVDGSPFTEKTEIGAQLNCAYGHIASHTHVYGDWEMDETGHWKKCACGNIVKAAHTASGWITVTEATETTEGLRHKVCTVCGYEMETETIPAIVVINKVDDGGIRLTLSNGAAGTCLAALYDSDGRMLTAASLEVAAGAGNISLSFPAFEGKPAAVKSFSWMRIMPPSTGA